MLLIKKNIKVDFCSTAIFILLFIGIWNFNLNGKSIENFLNELHKNRTNSVQTSLIIETPNGGENWIAGKYYSIAWNFENVSNIKIEYTINAGRDWNLVEQSVPAASRSYYWEVPNVGFQKCKVKITSENDSTIFDESDNYFFIKCPESYITKSSDSLIFGSINFVSTKQLELSITNRGLLNCSITLNKNYNGSIIKFPLTTDSAFSISNNEFSIKPDSTIILKIIFAPKEIKEYKDTILISINALKQNCRIVENFFLKGISFGSKISLQENILDFEDVLIGRTKNKSLTLINTGNYDLIVNSFKSKDTVFKSSSQSFTVSPSSSKTIFVQFKPLKNSSYSDTLKIEHNSVNSPAIVLIKGNGFYYPSELSIAKEINFGSAEDYSNYKIIGLPGKINLLVSSLLIGKQNYDWNVYWDNGDSVSYQIKCDGSAIFNFKPGNAFWILSRNGMDILKQVENVSIDSNNCFKIPLHNGWNLISSPFEKDVQWSKVISINSLKSNQLIYSWNGQWTNPQSMKIFEGYYFNNYENKDSLKIPYNPSVVLNKQNLANQNNNQAKNEIKLSLNIDDAEKSFVTIGIDSSANNDFDTLDYFIPPGDFEKDRISIYNDKLNVNYKHLSIEKRNTINEGEVFEIKIKRNSLKPAFINVDGVNNYKDYEIFLLDNNLKKFYNLKENSKIKISDSHSNFSFSLIIGKENFIQQKKSENKIDNFILYQNYPNPFYVKGNEASKEKINSIIKYQIAKRSFVQIKIYNLLGKEIASIINEAQDSGIYTFDISNLNLNLTTGVYFYQLIAKSETEIFTNTKKMLLIK